jgi:polyisoprenoid-binding protein YceI
LDEIVLESDKYPEITFNSTAVKGTIKNGAFEVKINGDLTLHGVKRQITIPAVVTLDGNDLRAVGEFEIDRKDFNVNATNAFHGMVRVKHTLKFVFDIIGRRI